MAHETSKQATRRSADRRCATRWMRGKGIDIGCGYDSLANLVSFFPLITSVRSWDLPDGDGMLMQGVEDSSFDFVHSSHCLEHLLDPYVAMQNWIRICRDGGHLIVTVPDEDLYEQGVWPSTFNADHKWSFTIAKRQSWCPKSVNVFDLLGHFVDDIEVLKVELLDSGFVYAQPRQDQSLGALSESAIEFVLRRKCRAVRHAGFAPSVDAAEAFAEAIAHHKAGDAVSAAASYRRAMAGNPRDVASLNNLSLLTSPDESEALLRRALVIKPDFADALVNLATLLMEKPDVVEAESCLKRASLVRPDDANVFYRLGLCLEAQDLHAEAASAFERATVLEDRHVAARLHLGKLLVVLGNDKDALNQFEKILAHDPQHVEAHVYKGQVHLGLGDLHRGAEEIKWIWHTRGLSSQMALFAEGSSQRRDLDGRRIVLSADSAIGDTLQFIRYAAMLKARGACVIVECQSELVRLLQNTPAIDTVVTLGQELPAFDDRVPLHNLIGAFGTTLPTIPANVPYVTATAAEAGVWREKLGRHQDLTVGLVWAGASNHVADRRRSIAATLLKPLMDVDGVRWVSLQKNAAAAHDLDLLDWTADLHDMGATAALIESLDLVISVDSSVAHLAGALGRPVWLLNRFDSCWRWLKERNDSPWYPTMRQFRQTRAGEWQPVVAAVVEALTSLSKEHASLSQSPGSQSAGHDIATRSTPLSSNEIIASDALLVA